MPQRQVDAVRMAQSIHNARLALINMNLDSARQANQKYVEAILEVLDYGITSDEWCQFMQDEGYFKSEN